MLVYLITYTFFKNKTSRHAFNLAIVYTQLDMTKVINHQRRFMSPLDQFIYIRGSNKS
jgi:hypothetical protein